MSKQNIPKRIDGTGRIEAFSDGVLAIIMTLLIFELHVPVLKDLSNSAVWQALYEIAQMVSALPSAFLRSQFSGSLIIISFCGLLIQTGS
jgi:uncharacterized membrane protein